jgi:hypothetical protein
MHLTEHYYSEKMDDDDDDDDDDRSWARGTGGMKKKCILGGVG